MTTTPERKMIDIHMHLIPSVDDGAEDMMMAMAMLIRAREQGITHIFATPHSSAFDNYTTDGVLEKYGQLCDMMDRYFPDIEIYPGCEIYCERNRMEDIHYALRHAKYLPMYNTNIVLLEFSKWVSPEDARYCTEAVAGWGYIPIIAHYERYCYLRIDMTLLERLHKCRAQIQVNVYSLYDEADDSIRSWVRQLVLEKTVRFLGTDAHRTYHRPPSRGAGSEMAL